MILRIRPNNFWSSNYIECESNDDRNKKTIIWRIYLKAITNNLKKSKKSNTWKIQLIIANNFISSIDNDEERVIHSKSDNIDNIINVEADKVIKEHFDSIKNRYQNKCMLFSCHVRVS